MIPSSPGAAFPSNEIPPPSEPMDVETPSLSETDEKAHELADKWLTDINSQIATESGEEAHAYFLENRDSTPASEIFIKLVEDLYNESQMMESSDAVAEVVHADPVEIEWNDERFAWETANFRELLDNVVEARKEIYSHDFRAFVERVTSSVGLKIDDLMPNLSDDIVYVHEAWKKLNDAINLKDVIHLDLSGLDLHALPPEVAEMDHLEELILTNNKLLTLPKEIGQLSYLRRLIADHNVLKTLPKEMGDLIGLVELDLSFNRLERVPDSFRNLVNLQTLDLSVNRLYEEPRQVEGLKSLHNLVTYGNRF